MTEPLVMFFGDDDHAFALTVPLVVELEALTGSGIGAVMQRVTSLEFRTADLVETIRLGLIGGGMSPETAKRFVETYVVGRPIFREIHPVAAAILNHLWSGPASVEPETELATFVPPVPPTSEIWGEPS